MDCSLASQLWEPVLTWSFLPGWVRGSMLITNNRNRKAPLKEEEEAVDDAGPAGPTAKHFRVFPMPIWRGKDAGYLSSNFRLSLASASPGQLVYKLRKCLQSSRPRTPKRHQEPVLGELLRGSGWGTIQHLSLNWSVSMALPLRRMHGPGHQNEDHAPWVLLPHV